MYRSVELSRRSLLAGPIAVAVCGVEQNVRAASVHASESQQPQPAKRPPIVPELVKDFVIAAHRDLDRTKSLLAEEPRLLNATWDWGGGDFEMAIGGAGHMGRRDIARFLIDNGGRMDIFVAAMLGELEIVRSTLKAFPNMLNSRGPHGITLLAHARAGGDQAGGVLSYLQSLPQKS